MNKRTRRGVSPFRQAIGTGVYDILHGVKPSTKYTADGPVPCIHDMPGWMRRRQLMPCGRRFHQLSKDEQRDAMNASRMNWGPQ